jgi:hypothetical protein
VGGSFRSDFQAGQTFRRKFLKGLLKDSSEGFISAFIPAALEDFTELNPIKI